jgi:hypothetical protein
MYEAEVKRLNEIYLKQGALSPPLVLEAARKDGKQGPLWSHFEWDDTIAGEKHRLWQAMMLLNTVKIKLTVSTGEVESVRAFPSIRQDRNMGPCEEVDGL